MRPNYDVMVGRGVDPFAFAWTARDAILYALSLGLGRDPFDAAALRFVMEPGLRVVPTLATVIGRSRRALLQECGLPVSQLLHGQERLFLHRPMKAAGEGVATQRIGAVHDLGPGRAALVRLDTHLHDMAGDPLATRSSLIFVRDGGGFGGVPPPPRTARGEDRPPDEILSVETQPDQALLYRLNGDMNPLHARRDVAQAAGFDRPIMHGQCIFGIACAAVLRACADFEPDRMRSCEGRFSAPVYPGERLEICIWKRQDGVDFDVHVPARATVAMRQGAVEWREEGAS